MLAARACRITASITAFTDPVTWDFSDPNLISHAVLGRRMSRAFAGFSATHHAITNHRITLDGDRALIRAHIEAQQWVPTELVAPSTETCWHVIGFYDDVAVRTRDGWRLTSVKLTVRHQTGQAVFAASMAQGQR